MHSKQTLAEAPAPSPAAPTISGSRTSTRLGSSLQIRGEITGTEDLQIDGIVEGPIFLQGHELIVGATAQLKSEIPRRGPANLHCRPPCPESLRPRRGFSLIELLIVVAIILIIAAIAIPNLLRSKMAANEASAVGSMRTINTSSVAFSTTYGNYPTKLSDLGPSTAPTSTAADLIDSALVTGSKSGYTFTFAAASPYQSYSLQANPTTPGVSGQRYFYTDQSGVIRYNLSTVATSADSPIS